MNRYLRAAALILACWVTLAPAQYGPEYPEGDSISYTALWWNPAESGWGLNTNHQGNIVFATLFTYAPDGQPMWLVASNLAGMGENLFSGPLYRTTGPPFNQVPWSAIGFSQVGTMSIEFFSASAAMLTYTFNGTPVSKSVIRQVFGTPVPHCDKLAGSRAGVANYQDLWWNPAESGWGLNMVQQGTTIFATLFTYTAAGRDGWLVASGLVRQTDGSYLGGLYSTTGPAFNASPWTPIDFAEVGTMRLRFTNGERGTLEYSVSGVSVTKAIERQVFAATAPVCR